MRIYERGVGYSEACGSGVMALTQLFHDQGVLPVGKKIQISMPGGSAIAWMTVDGKLALQADVNCVFSGEWLANPVF
jgi:diaminopimelate epimerase